MNFSEPSYKITINANIKMKSHIKEIRSPTHSIIIALNVTNAINRQLQMLLYKCLCIRFAGITRIS